MNKFPSKETVIRLREQYPHGCRVELVQMDDPYSKLKPGDHGTVDFVDDTGTIFCNWDSGSTLGVVFGEDVVKKLSVKIDATPMDGRLKEQILYIRDSGPANMFDVPMVLRLANDCGYHELVIFITQHKKEYVHFILTGETLTDGSEVDTRE